MYGWFWEAMMHLMAFFCFFWIGKGRGVEKTLGMNDTWRGFGFGSGFGFEGVVHKMDER